MKPKPSQGRRTSNHALSATFVAGTSEWARTPEGGLRSFPGDSFRAALERNGLRTQSLVTSTKYIATSKWRARGYVGARGIPMSLGFVVDLARSRTPLFVCREYGVDTLLTLVVARLRHRRALVFQEHTGRQGAPLSYLDTRYRRIIGRLATGFIANTKAARDEIVQQLRVPRERVFQVTILVPPHQDEMRREAINVSPPRARPLFLFMGQLVARKNVEAILRAAETLHEQNLEFEAWIGGEGSDEMQLRATARERGLGERVRFLGPIPYPSVGFLYEACDVFIMPSHEDYRSVAVLEALRFGKPVVDSARDGNAHDTVQHEVNGFIFEPTSPLELADCMRRFILDPQLAAEMGSRSNALMSEHTPDTAARALIDVLSQVASRNA